MSDSTLSAALKEAYASAPSNVIIYHTLEINHPTFATPIYVVRDFDDLTAKLETGTTVTFVRFMFDLIKPEVSPVGISQCTVAFDNVSRDILSYIQLAMTTMDLITITYREYISSDLNEPQNNPPLAMTLSEIKVDVFRITAVAGFGDFNNKRFPVGDYSAERFPWLVA